MKDFYLFVSDDGGPLRCATYEEVQQAFPTPADWLPLLPDQMRRFHATLAADIAIVERTRKDLS